MLRPGQTAPLFEAKSDEGQPLSLLTLRGQWVVLYFFPRALTPACSLEAREFEQSIGEFQQRSAQVIGVSSDTEARQALFRDTCHLSFPLLPDSDRRVCRAYGVLGGLGGWLGLSHRCTYLIDPAGLVAQVWPSVKPGQHAAEILRELSTRQQVSASTQG
ncbi:peroxiredoxin [Deinococcus rubellus]|uniref:thioredoxin-dependent peroxiredoxin n=1 Tax=Deinococcus rubellus TaxID=1889240 RepID=A0ABY5YKB2_9DEIO|nr:peroxiredoxin [Deinococcus rubellus]UWX65550.1 peroxiredoxin [Deinococcus rubellus]